MEIQEYIQDIEPKVDHYLRWVPYAFPSSEVSIHMFLCLGLDYLHPFYPGIKHHELINFSRTGTTRNDEEGRVQGVTLAISAYFIDFATFN